MPSCSFKLFFFRFRPVVFRLPILLFFLFISALVGAQTIYVQGIVTDSVSGEAVSFASVQLDGTTIGTATDIDGYFSLRYSPGNNRLKVSSVGYHTKTIFVSNAKEPLSIKLAPADIGLNEVIVRPEKQRYSRKNNPAVELIRKTIERKEQNRMKNVSELRYEQYEKLSIYWDNFKLENKFLKKNFGFIENHLDTSVFTRQQVLTLSLRETLSDVHENHKTTIAQRTVGAEETFNDGATMDIFLAQIFKEVDVYDDNIDILLNKFVSPTSSFLATVYYKFYIQDTLTIDDMRCVNVAFFPFNPQSYSFNGNLYIAIDNNYAIKRADLSIPRNLNINFLENLRIVRHFNLQENGVWVNEKEDIYANFAMTSFLTKVYAHQVRSYRNFSIEASDPNVEPQAPPIAQTDEFWQNRRHLPLKNAEADLPKLVDELQRVPLYRRFEKFLEIIITGYIKTANERKSKSKIDIGPIYTIYGKNPIEGHRLRLGAMTTAHLHPQIFVSGYTAYGFADRKWKYSATVAYSFVKKQNYLKEFPRNDVSFTAEYDLYSLGMQMDDALKDNLFVALGTAGIANRSYQSRYKLAYTVDWTSGMGISLWWKHSKDTPAGDLKYVLKKNQTETETIGGFRLSKVGAEVSYSPGMTKFGANREGKNSKVNFINDNIRFTLTHEYAYKGFSGGDYRFHQTQATVANRFWFSSFGHLDVQLSGGKIWNRVPFPMLASPRVNPSFFMEKNHFHLMRPFEFVTDEFAALHASYFLKGWIFNRIPLLNKLQLREVFTFNGYYGNLTDKNNPSHSFDVFVLPQSTNVMRHEMYMEGSVGIENIFKVFRVDYFRRFTHLDLPYIQKHGIKIGFRFAF